MMPKWLAIGVVICILLIAIAFLCDLFLNDKDDEEK